jgi:hypothetical protein
MLGEGVLLGEQFVLQGEWFGFGSRVKKEARVIPLCFLKSFYG